MSHAYLIYELRMTYTGRIEKEVVAMFMSGDDAVAHAKQHAFRWHVNTMVVFPSGDIRIYSEYP
jgi:hypothetical protein